MTRITTLALTLGALGAAIPSGFAGAPPVDTGQFATAMVTVGLPDGDQLSLGLRAVAGQQGDRLLVSTARCNDEDGCVTGDLSGPLPDGALTTGSSTSATTLRVDLGGQPLAVTWRPTGDSMVLLGGVDGSGTGAGTQASTYEGAPAAVTVDYLGGTCREAGGLGDGVVVDTGGVIGTPATRPLTALRVREGAVLACS
jgi:hypothetical protein